MLYKKLGILTIILIYLLVLAGGIVRSTGSGMGCPDWPKCFGMIVPPTDVSQLPYNYQQIYNDKLHGEVEFNVTKTWIEYLNRLLGALSGLSVFVLFLVTFFKYRKSRKELVFYSFLSVVLIGLNGALGKYVVDTNLKPGIVTLHMLLAILVLFSLLYLVVKSSDDEKALFSVLIINKKKIVPLIYACIFISTVQVLLGSQVRENVDTLLNNIIYSKDRYSLVDNLGIKFIIHRSFSILLLLFNLVLLFTIYGAKIASKSIKFLSFALAFGIGLEIISGILLAYLGIPPLVQPVHLTLALIIIGIQFVLLLKIKEGINANTKYA